MGESWLADSLLWADVNLIELLVERPLLEVLVCWSAAYSSSSVP
jgi:hypothetical protein